MLERGSRGREHRVPPYAVDKFVAGGDGSLAVARLRHADDGETRELEIGGAFIAIGHEPQSQLVAGQVEFAVGVPPAGKNNLATRR